jgi:tetratricopeptide (TPR) repeat protein
MKRATFMMLALCAFALTVHASDENEIAALFVSANQAYDRGEYDAARKLYLDIAARSPSSIEAWYNAANAAFRGGATGEAVLYYRRAWFLNPRDADVLANLQLAVQRTGARVPPTSLIENAATELSQAGWKRFFQAGYWLSFVLAVPLILLPAARRFIQPWLLLALLMTCAGLAGWLYWQHWRQQDESVVVTGRQVARYEPREQATEFFALPEGSIIFREETFDQWVKVRAGDQSGWVPADAVRQVNTWQVP